MVKIYDKVTKVRASSQVRNWANSYQHCLPITRTVIFRLMNAWQSFYLRLFSAPGKIPQYRLFVSSSVIVCSSLKKSRW